MTKTQLKAQGIHEQKNQIELQLNAKDKNPNQGSRDQ